MQAGHACSQLLALASATPTVPLALRSLLTPTDPSRAPTGCPGGSPAQVQQGSPPASPSSNPQTQSPEQQKQALVVQMTMHAALRPIMAHVPDSIASTSGRNASTESHGRPSSRSESTIQLLSGRPAPDTSRKLGSKNRLHASDAGEEAAMPAAAHFACHVITAPQLLAQLPAAAYKQLTQQPVLMSIMAALQLTVSTGSNTGTNPTGTCQKGSSIRSDGKEGAGECLSKGIPKGRCLSGIGLHGPLDAVLALGNLAELLSGRRITKAIQVCSHAVPINRCQMIVMVTKRYRGTSQNNI